MRPLVLAFCLSLPALASFLFVPVAEPRSSRNAFLSAHVSRFFLGGEMERLDRIPGDFAWHSSHGGSS
jgi:hypothetical protein